VRRDVTRSLSGLRDRLLFRIRESTVDTYDIVLSATLASSLSMNESSVPRVVLDLDMLSIEFVNTELKGSLYVVIDDRLEESSACARDDGAFVDWWSDESSATEMADSSIPKTADISDKNPNASSWENVLRLGSLDIHRNSDSFQDGSSGSRDET
jgi:hypothetical protein